MKKSSTIFLAIIVSLTNLFIMPGEITLATAVNLVTNPSVESVSPTNASVPDSWLTGKWGTNSAIFTYDSSGYTGSKSLKVDMTNYSSGDAKWYFNPISVTPGGTYTFSDYYKSNVITSIVAQFDNGSGSYQYLNLNSNIPTSSTWQSTTSTFTVPSGYNNLTIFHLIDKVGSLNIDDMSLSEVVSSTPSVSITSPINNSSISGTIILSASATDTNGISSVQFQIDGVNTGTPINTSPYSLNWDSSMTANGSHKISAIATNSLGVQATSNQISLNVNNTTSGNFISNPSFETAKPTNSKSPLNWQSSKWGTNTTTFNYLASGGYTGNRAVQVVTSRYTNGDAKWFFDPIAVMPNTQYSFSDYYKSNINTEVDAVFTMPNGSTIYQLIGLPSASTVWTKFSTTFTVPLGATSMTIYHLIHGVGSLTIDNVNLQRYTPIGFNRPLATITFDDGFANSYTQALPLLNKYGFGSTQFITTGLVNTDGYLSTSQLQSLATAGSEIASHSVTHSNLSIATATSYTNELSASQSQLKAWTGQSISSFAFPYGLYNKNVANQAKKYYAACRGVESGLNSKDNLNVYDIKVENITSSTTDAQIADWLAQAKATNTWLVLVYHSVDVTDSMGVGEYNITPAQFDSQLSAIKSSGITVLTMQQALTEIKSQL